MNIALIEALKLEQDSDSGISVALGVSNSGVLIPFEHPNLTKNILPRNYKQPVKVEIDVGFRDSLHPDDLDKLATRLNTWGDRGVPGFDSSHIRLVFCNATDVVAQCFQNHNGGDSYTFVFSPAVLAPLDIPGLENPVDFGNGTARAFISPFLLMSLGNDGLSEVASFIKDWASGAHVHRGAGGSQSRAFGQNQVQVSYQIIDDELLVLRP